MRLRPRLSRTLLAAWLSLAVVVGVHAGAFELAETAWHAGEAPCHADCDDACPEGGCDPGCQDCACCVAPVSVVPPAPPIPGPASAPAEAPFVAASAAPVRTPPGVFRPPRIRV